MKNDNIRVCMVIPSFSAKGGITSVASGYKDSKLTDDFDIRFVETYCDGSFLKKILFAFKAYFSYRKILYNWNPEIIHVHSSFGGSFYRKMFFIKAANKLKIPVINHVHGADFEEFFLNASKRKKNIIKNIYNSCLFTIALSDEWKNKLIKIIPDNKIKVIENYSIINELSIEKRISKANNHSVLFLGFLCKRKGCFDIPDIIKKVKNNINDVIFILAGSGEQEKLEQLIDNDIKENVKFPGWIRGEEKQLELENSDLFFLPSYNEGMPMSILDAMGYGLPIISTNVGGIPKIVHNGENGYIFDPGDTDGMARAIIDLLLDDKKRLYMGNNSVKIVQNGYSITNHINKIEELYKKCLTNR